MYDDIRIIEDMFGSDLSDTNISWEMNISLSSDQKDAVEKIMNSFHPSYGFEARTFEDDDTVLIKFSGSIQAESYYSVPSVSEMAEWLDSLRAEFQTEAEDLSQEFWPVIQQTSVDVYNW